MELLDGCVFDIRPAVGHKILIDLRKELCLIHCINTLISVYLWLNF